MGPEQQGQACRNIHNNVANGIHTYQDGDILQNLDDHAT
jgi:hypothetical protein